MNAYLRKALTFLLTMIVGIGIGSTIFYSPKPVEVEPRRLETVTEVKVDDVSQRELNKLAKENRELKLRLKELKAKPVMVIESEVLIEGRTEVRDDIPDLFLYQTSDGLTVASHRIDGGSFSGTTYDLMAESKIVVSKGKDGNTYAHSETTIVSSYSEEKKKVVMSELQAIVLKQRPRIKFSPLVDVQVMADLDGTFSAVGGAYTGLQITARHDLWIGAGVDVSNRQIRPSAKLVIRF
jgi:hypothetical protein